MPSTPAISTAPPLDREALDRAALEYCSRLARDGNPFPFIAYQWPHLVITDPNEARYFQGTVGDMNDPCLRLDDWQRDIARAFFDEQYSEILIKGNTKAGKGCVVAICVNVWFEVYAETKVILTSQRFEHAAKVMFAEVAKWRDEMTSRAGDRLKAGVSDDPQHYITIANPASGEGFSGQHGPRTIFIIDEATSVPDGRYEDAQKQARKIVALANPRTLSGWFRRAFDPCIDLNKTQTVLCPAGLRRCVTVSGDNCKNVKYRRLERPIGPAGGITINGPNGTRTFAHNERIPSEYFANVQPLIPEQCDYGRYMAICQHKDPRHVDVFGRGYFPTEDEEKQVILGSWLAFHTAAWSDGGIAAKCFGLDVSASLDGDETILTAGGEDGVAAIHRFQDPDTMATVGWVQRVALGKHGIDLRAGRVPICVDMDGLGKGVGDRLREIGCWVIEFRGNASSIVDPHRYVNMRAESYGELGRRLDPRGPWGKDPFALPSDPFLLEELCAPEKIYSGGDGLRFGLTPKRRHSGMKEDAETVQDKIGRSPDTGDSCVYMFTAVRELGLWSSQMERIAMADAAFPQDDKQFAQDRENVEKAIDDPESDMDPATRELLKHFRDRARASGGSLAPLARGDDW